MFANFILHPSYHSSSCAFFRDDLWFDDVDPDDIEAAIGAEAAEIMRKKQGIKKNDKNPETALVKEKAFDG